MSSIEVDRLEVIEHRLSRSDGAVQLGITPRHMSRIVAAYKVQGKQEPLSARRWGLIGIVLWFTQTGHLVKVGKNRLR